MYQARVEELREGEAVGDDENDEEDIDDAADRMGFAAHFQHVVELQPPGS